MKRWIQLISILLAAQLLLSGCGLYTQRSYSSVTTHVEQRVNEDDPSVLRAESYQELVSAILWFVTEGAESGTVRLYQYTGDVESDLNAACKEVLEGETLGVYALSGLEHDYSRIVSYYECTFQLTFQHTAEEINAVSSAATIVSLREQIQQGMDSFVPSLAFRTSLRTTEEQIQDIVESYYLRTPQLALGRPEVEVTYYEGTDATQRIIEVRFTYPLSASQAQAQDNYVYSTVQQLAVGLDPTRENLWMGYQSLTENRVISDDGSDSIYEYLYRKEGSDEAAAMAVLLLCQQMDLDAELVQGTDLRGNPHTWVALSVEGRWCHLDPTQDNREKDFLRSDEEMELAYNWDHSTVAACEGYSLEEPEKTAPGETENPEESASIAAEETVPGEGTRLVEQLVEQVQGKMDNLEDPDG